MTLPRGPTSATRTGSHDRRCRSDAPPPPRERREEEADGYGHPREYPGDDRRLQLPERGGRAGQQVHDREADRDTDAQQQRRGPAASAVATEDDRHDGGQDEPLRNRHDRELADPRLESSVEHVRDVVRCQQGEQRPRRKRRASASRVAASAKFSQRSRSRGREPASAGRLREGGARSLRRPSGRLRRLERRLAPSTSTHIRATASSSVSPCSRVSDCHVGNASAWPIAARVRRAARPAGRGRPSGCPGSRAGSRGSRRAGAGRSGRRARRAAGSRTSPRCGRRTRRARAARSRGARPGPRSRPTPARSGGGFAARQCDEHASNSASSSGKWRYTVERRTPARSAIALIEVRAGPSCWCSATALSVIRVRVCSSSSARRFIR